MARFLYANNIKDELDKETKIFEARKRPLGDFPSRVVLREAFNILDETYDFCEECSTRVLSINVYTTDEGHCISTLRVEQDVEYEVENEVVHQCYWCICIIVEHIDDNGSVDNRYCRLMEVGIDWDGSEFLNNCHEVGKEVLKDMDKEIKKGS